MEKSEHAEKLRLAMAARGLGRPEISAATGKGDRTVTNWTTGKTMPDDRDRAALRKILPGYDDLGDQVEVAIMHSELTEDRRHTLVGVYKRMLREQSEGGSAIGY